jgi:hypothetical protein
MALEARLGFIADRQRWPDIAREKIVRPMIILGLPRSGSTFLHTLLSQDPANRVPLTWEMILPSPPPSAADAGHDRRIACVDALLAAMGVQAPDILALHPFGARLPEEDHLMTEIALLGDNLPAFWRMPTFNQQRAKTPAEISFRTLIMMLQTLQFRHHRERLLLKDPGHVLRLTALINAFPDALIVQTHRDPAKVLPSVSVLLRAMRLASSDDVAPLNKFAVGNLRAFAVGLAQAMDLRRDPSRNGQFVDVHFRRMISDPIGTAESIYRHFGLTLMSDARQAMQRWLADPASRTPKGHHSLADCGLDHSTIDQAFGRYLDHYGIERERADS